MIDKNYCGPGALVAGGSEGISSVYFRAGVQEVEFKGRELDPEDKRLGC